MAWGQNSRLFSFGFQNNRSRQKEQNNYTMPPQQGWRPQQPQGSYPYQGMQPNPYPYPGMQQQPNPYPNQGMQPQQPSSFPYQGMQPPQRGQAPQPMFTPQQGQAPQSMFTPQQGQAPQPMFTPQQGQAPQPMFTPQQGQAPQPMLNPPRGQNPQPMLNPQQGQAPQPMFTPPRGQNPQPMLNPQQGQNPQAMLTPQQGQNPQQFQPPGFMANANQNHAAPKQNIPPEAKVTPLNGSSFDEIKKQVLQNADIPESSVVPQLKQLIQNEANGELYYASLSQMCGNAEHSDTIREIVNECKEHKSFYTGQFKKLAAENYAAETRDIARITNFSDGVTLALREENKMLRQVKDFYKSAPDNEKLHLIPYVLDKVARISSLSLLQ